MPDITMCMEHACPRRMTCYRYMAKPNPHWQSYYKAESVDWEHCKDYIPMKGVKDEDVPHPRV